MNTKALVSTYFEFLKQRDTEGLKDVFTPDLKIQTPIGEWNGLDSFLNEIQRNRWSLINLDLKKLVQEGNEACLIYEAESSNPNIGKIIFAEWLSFKDGKISSILSSFDATPLRKALIEI